MSQNHTPLTMTLGFRTDVGRQRTNNEDAVATFSLPGAEAAFVVCDGMGGLRAGDLAANEALRVIQTTLTDLFSQGASDPIKALGEAFRRANDAVNALAPVEETSPAPSRGNDYGSPTVQQEALTEKRRLMGTTCVAGVVRDEILYLGHAGDSRAYRWRRGHLTRLTEDHSFVAERVRAGDMTEAEARVSRFRNIVTRAIGIDATVEPEFRREPLEPGDAVLVCSDGLTTMLDDPEIANLMNRPNIRRSTPEQAAAQFVDAANRAGGADNVTVLLLKVAGDPVVTDHAEIIDIDFPRRRSARGNTALLWALLGMLLTLAVLMALFTFYAPFRDRVAQFANPTPVTTPSPTGTPTAIPKTPVDYARLVYDAPVPFGDYLARGDLLTYAPGMGLYFVAGSTGKVARLDANAEAVISVESLEIAPIPADYPSTHVFLTSDPQGNVYISYTQKKIIEKISAGGTLIGRIRGFERPEAIAVDERGNIYVVDFNQIKICKAHLPVTPSPSPRASGSPPPKGRP